MNKKQIRKHFVLQHDHTDCGVACLASVIRLYGGDVKLERLRELSGTTQTGTTLMGIHQAAKAAGIVAEAYSGVEIQNLKELEHPAILPVVLQGSRNHFVLVYGFENGKFIIGDPGKGLEELSEAALLEIWTTGMAMTLEKGENFVLREQINSRKFQWLRELIREDFNVLMVSLVLGFFLAIIGLSVAVYSQKLIDKILPSGDDELLLIGLFALGFVLIIQAGLGYLRGFFLIGQTRDFNNRIVGSFFSSLLFLPKTFFDSRKVGDMIARLNDTGRIQRTVSMLFAGMAIDLLTVIVSALFVMLYAWKIGLVALLSIPVYGLIMYLYNPEIIRQQRSVMAAYAQNESNYVDSIRGIEPIKSGNRENIFIGLTRNIFGIYQDVTWNLGKLGLKLSLSTGLASGALNLIIISWASFLVLHDELQLGQMMAIIQIAGMLIPAVGRLATVNIPLQEALVAFDRMFEFAGLDPEYSPEAEAQKHNPEKIESISARNIGFSFPGRPPLLHDISFEVNRGEMITLLGESGCGKSTLLQLLQRFYHLQEGQLLVNGLGWNELSTPGWRSKIAAVPQETRIFNGNLLNNIALDAIDWTDQESSAEAASELVKFCQDYGFHDFFMRFPQQYLTLLGEEGVNISGGQQQLVALARALYQRPQVLLLDEATSAMDRQTEGFILQLLERLKDEIAVILVTHRIKTASRSDRIYVIEQGKVSASGAHEELLKSRNFYSLSWEDLMVGLPPGNQSTPPATP